MKFRWGILGTGFAATKFVHGLRASAGAEAAAVASRSKDRAAAFATGMRVARAFGSYEEAVCESDVDAFYVATPASCHRDHALLCLNAGRAVLVEKPLALNAREAREVAAAARANSLFCMEAMWTRFLPIVRHVKQVVAEGSLGDVRTVTASFGTPEPLDPARGVFRGELGGGALLDRGVYPLSLAFHLLGPAAAVLSQAVIGETGVDEDVAAVLRHDRGALSILSASLRTQMSNDCVISGTRGAIRVHAPIFRPFRMTLRRASERAVGDPSLLVQRLKEHPWLHRARQRLDRIRAPFDPASTHRTVRYAGNGYHYEAEEVARCVANGQLESEIMPLAESVGILETMDTMRSQWAPAGDHAGPVGGSA